jgi:hypothetical protein
MPAPDPVACDDFRKSRACPGFFIFVQSSFAFAAITLSPLRYLAGRFPFLGMTMLERCALRKSSVNAIQSPFCA